MKMTIFRCTAKFRISIYSNIAIKYVYTINSLVRLMYLLVGHQVGLNKKCLKHDLTNDNNISLNEQRLRIIQLTEGRHLQDVQHQQLKDFLCFTVAPGWWHAKSDHPALPGLHQICMSLNQIRHPLTAWWRELPLRPSGLALSFRRRRLHIETNFNHKEPSDICLGRSTRTDVLTHTTTCFHHFQIPKLCCTGFTVLYSRRGVLAQTTTCWRLHGIQR